MTDQELVDRFEDGTLPNECFHHREHVRVAFLYLTSYPVLEALQLFSKTLRRFAEAHGKPELYHETITWAYVFLIRERMARAGKKQSWDEFAWNNPDMLAWKGGILTRYYRAETLTSDLARAVFILPELRT
jgi:hypothetical protein